MAEGRLQTVVFMFTDIEGSTHLWEAYPEAMKTAVLRHDRLIDEWIARCGGRVIDHAGDGVFAVFETKEGDPLGCALEIQRDLQRADWGVLGELRVRMALHRGIAHEHGGDYLGPPVNRTARMMATGWGGQILVTPELAATFPLPEGAILRDLGVHQLKDLNEPQQICELVHPDLKLKEFPSLGSLSACPHNLPAQPTQFIGREVELREISQRLGDESCRLLTLVGPGGIGKTRLALQVAADQIEAFADGAYFIPLASLPSADYLVSVVAETLKLTFHTREDPEAQLLRYLHEREMLLVLDNFEHLLEGADLLVSILQEAPKIKLLTTSRERLNLRGELIYEIQGMKVPTAARGDGAESHDVVQLFFSCAHRADPRFTLIEKELPHVVHICRLVGGMPLGVELAAAWVRLLPLEEIVQELQVNLDLLETRMRDAPTRHRSVRAVFESSWQLLGEEERAAFRKISIFRGGFTREAAQDVAGASLHDLSSLMDKSFLRRRTGGRYEVHELLRQYGEAKLQELGRAVDHRTRHLQFFLRLAERAEPELRGVNQGEWLARLEEEHDNLRAAMAWSLEGGARAEGLALAGVLWPFWMVRGHWREGREWLERMLSFARPGGGDARRAKALHGTGVLAQHQGDYPTAREHLEESLAIRRELDDRIGRAITLKDLGTIHARLGDLPEALEHYRQAGSLYHELEDRQGEGEIRANLGALHHLMGEEEQALSCYLHAQKIFQELGNRRAEAKCLSNLGTSYLALGDHEASLNHFRRALEIYDELGDESGRANSLGNVGVAYERLKLYDEALRFHLDALGVQRRIEDRRGAARTQYNLGSVYLKRRDPEAALAELQRALSLAEELELKQRVIRSLSAIGEVQLQLGRPPEALETSERAIQLLREHPSTGEPERIHYTHFRILQACGQLEDGLSHLREAYETIAQRASYIADEELRGKFLAAHREVLAAWETRRG
jgi:predicted ATPase/class 3 adenylate cyclase/Tfp pilus assembly protein PilF